MTHPRLVAFVIAPAFGFLAASPADAANRVRVTGMTGVGVGSGTLANGLSFKQFLEGSRAVQANLGSLGLGRFGDRFGGYGGIALSADYLLPFGYLVRSGFIDVAWNAGAGVGLGVSTSKERAEVAASGVLGLELLLVPAPVDLVIEYRPVVGVIPGFGIDVLDFTAHLRVYF
jgi:hypothetical protein